jgi:uncharacterized LabA/DUF88 family protein
MRAVAPMVPTLKTQAEAYCRMILSDRLALFIDGQNLHFTTKALGFEVDFKRLLAYFAAQSQLVRAYYYATILEDQEFQSIRPLTDWLEYNGFTVLAKPAKEFDDGEGRRKIKRSIAVDIAVDAIGLAKYIDHAVLITGDGDLRSVIAAVQRRGVRVTVASTLRITPLVISAELRRQADDFIELDDLKGVIGQRIG